MLAINRNSDGFRIQIQGFKSIKFIYLDNLTLKVKKQLMTYTLEMPFDVDRFNA